MNLVLLSVPSEDDLNDLAIQLTGDGIEHYRFFEPDLDSHTALASRPSPRFANLPLLLKEENMPRSLSKGAGAPCLQ